MVVPKVVPRVVPRVVPMVAAPLAAVLPVDHPVTPWVATLLAAVRRVAIRRAALGLGCPRVAWDSPQAEWAIAVVAPMAKNAKTAASRVVESVVAQVAMSPVILANSPAVDKAPSNLVKNWTSRSAISTKHSVRNSARWRQSVEIPKVLAMAPVALAVPLAWVNRKLADPVAVAQAVRLLAAAVVLAKVRRALSMA